MAEDRVQDDEKMHDASSSHTSDAETITQTSKEFAPIAVPRPESRTRTNSRSNSLGRINSRRSLSHVRSQNGYGCDEGENSGSEDIEAAGDAVEKDPFEVKWDGGDNDPLNPRSMNHARKWRRCLIATLCGGEYLILQDARCKMQDAKCKRRKRRKELKSIPVIGVTGLALALRARCVAQTSDELTHSRTCTSSIYTSTYEQITDEFKVSRLIATLGLSLFILGLGIGPMLLGPLSEFYGRRPIYLVSFSAFLIWLIPSAAAHNIQTMLIARFLDGLSGSAFLSVAGGTVGDMFNREQLQAPMLIYTASPFIGPSIGPLIGGFINQYTQWRWTFYVLIIWSAVNLAMIALLVPETYHPVLLRNKARRMRKETGDERWRAPMEKTNKSIPKTIAYSLLRPFQLLTLEPMCTNLCLFSAILLGILYLFFGAFPLVFRGSHGFTLSQTGLTFLGIFVGMMAGVCTDPFFHNNYKRLIRNREIATGEVGGSEPEYRLPPAIVGSILVPIGLFLFAWTTYPSVHWILPIIGSSIFGMGTVLVFTGIFTFLVDAYPLYAASSLAANSFARSSFGAAFPLFGIQMYHKLGHQWATSLLAFLTLAMMPFPYLFFKYGKKLRGKSRFASA